MKFLGERTVVTERDWVWNNGHQLSADGHQPDRMQC